MWTCPTCKREFRNAFQDHSCERRDPMDHFLGSGNSLLPVYEKLRDETLRMGSVKLHSLKHAILFAAKTNFLAVKPKKTWIDLEIILPYATDEFPVFKVVQASKFKWAHFIRISSVEEIDQQLIRWIADAHSTALK